MFDIKAISLGLIFPLMVLATCKGDKPDYVRRAHHISAHWKIPVLKELVPAKFGQSKIDDIIKEEMSHIRILAGKLAEYS